MLYSHLPNIEVTALKIEENSFLIGKTLSELKMRKAFGVTLVALKRQDKIIEHPEPNTKILQDDIAYILGKPEQIAHAIEHFSKPVDV